MAAAAIHSTTRGCGSGEDNARDADGFVFMVGQRKVDFQALKVLFSGAMLVVDFTYSSGQPGPKRSRFLGEVRK